MRKPIVIAGTALGVGAAAETLAVTVPARLDVALGLAAFGLALTALAQRRLVDLSREERHLGWAALVLLVALIWRDSPTLFALNTVALIGIAALAVTRAAVPLDQNGVATYLRRGVEALIHGMWQPVPLALALDWRAVRGSTRLQLAWRAGLGVLMVAPVALLFGHLFMEADPLFARSVERLFPFHVDLPLDHVVRGLVWSWGAAGLFYGAGRVGVLPALENRGGGRVAFETVCGGLAVIGLLFLAFVVVQLPYLFGGAALVAREVGLTVAEYARRGFFELVWVAALTLPLLLLAEWALDHGDPRRVRWFRWIAAGILVLLQVILVSALQRMRLYTSEFGLTELRLYTTAFMGWLVLVFAWFAATVLRGDRERFAFGALVAVGLTLGALNLINPDGVIARTNAERARRDGDLDVKYLSQLSADAAPALLAALPALPERERCFVARQLVDRRNTPPDRWNVAVRRLRLQRQAADVAVGSWCGALR